MKDRKKYYNFRIEFMLIVFLVLFAISLGCIVGNVYILIRSDVKGLYSYLHTDYYDNLSIIYKKGK
jgi:hypothetical protein